jgi:hypothetical protein
MNSCRAYTRTGEACRLPASGASREGLCWVHDPSNASARLRGQSRGGRGGNPETKRIKKLMDELTEKVLSGELEPARSHAVVALQNIKLRAIEIERKLEESDVRAEWEEVKRELGIAP